MCSSRRSSLLAIALLFAARGALAQTQEELDRAAELARKALASHESGDYLKAGAHFLEAYELSRLQVQLRNAAKSFELGADLDRARTLWRRYLALDGIPPPDREDAGRHLAAIEAKLAPPPPPPEPALAESEVNAVPEPEPVTSQWWFWVGGGALILAVVGVSLGFALRSGDDFVPSGELPRMSTTEWR